MNLQAIAARQFWEGIVNDAVAKLSDEDVVKYARVFAKPGSVCVLELRNHSVQRIESGKKKVEASHRWAILNDTVIDKLAPPKAIKRTVRSKS